MAPKNPHSSQIVSVRLPNDLVERLDRWLDWSETSRREKSSRNTAIRAALCHWLDEQELRAGFVAPHALRQQFQATYQSLTPHNDWVLIATLRQRLNWPYERFDMVLEGLRADHHLELTSAQPAEMSAHVLQESYQVHGHCYVRLRWRSTAR